jgi:EpsI family protein
MAGGLLHDFEGWSIFLVCVVLLMLEISALNLVGGRSTLRLNYLGLAKGPLFGAQPDLGRSGLAALGVVGLLGLSATIGLFTNSKSILPDHRDFAEFPMAFDRWHGRRGDIDANVLGELKLTDYVIADYSESFDKLPINLYVAFYASQTIGSSIHSPSTCIPGGGWRIVDNQVVTVPLPGLAAPVSLSRLVIQRGEAREMVYYWFDERGRDVTDQFAAKWHLMQESYHHHRTDGALIRYVTALAPGEDLAHAEERLRGFLALTVPTVEQFLPEPLADL